MLGFNELPSEAIKNKLDYYKFEEGENTFRIVGQILPRYVYWLKTPDGAKTIPMECLAFDREEVKFLNREVDWIQKLMPDEKCSWSYVCQAFDPEDGKLKVLVLKKKMFGEIKLLAQKHLGDITHLDTGSIMSVQRTKDGPLAYNVSYMVNQLDCKELPLTDEQKQTIEDSPTIEELFARPTPEEQKIFLERTWFSAPEEESVDDDSLSDMDDDI